MFRHLLPLVFLLVDSLSPVVAHSHGHAHAHLHKPRQAQPQDAKARWEQLHQNYLTNVRDSLEENGQCTWDNMVVRREWCVQSQKMLGVAILTK